MEDFKEIFSYSAMGALFIAIMIPLVGLIIASNKEIKRLDKAKGAKNRLKAEN